MKKIVVFGNGKIAQTITYYIRKWDVGEVSGYVVDREFLNEETSMGRPLVASDDVRTRFPPDEYAAFVALGYQDLNALRARKVEQMKTEGYTLISVVNPNVPSTLEFGDNALVIPDDIFIEPDVSLGRNVYVWNAVSISHFVAVEDNCWISNGTAIGGNATIGQNSFIGLGVIVNNRVRIGNDCLVGSGSLVTKDLADASALIPAATLPASVDARRAQALLR
jgi:sugar O-acyltransferase (sialic acid O-acetyltransferase NeuD family)